MKDLIEQFPKQLEDARSIGEKIDLSSFPKMQFNVIVLSGLGGSAIGGDLVRKYISSESKIPMFVNRHYVLPEFVNEKTLLFISSYSGNTEETISAMKDGMKRKAQIIAISSGGEIEKMARENKLFHIKIPLGYPPRAALGYSFVQQLYSLYKLKIISDVFLAELDDAAATIRKYSDGVLSGKEKFPMETARKLKGKFVIIYSSDDMEPCAVRFRQQVGENSKQIASHHVIPEMNHNEVVGWKNPKEILSDTAVILLRDAFDHFRIKTRFEICKKIFIDYTSHIIEINSIGDGYLERMLSLICVGDWISYYLALENSADPVPVEVIDYLKSQLEKIK